MLHAAARDDAELSTIVPLLGAGEESHRLGLAALDTGDLEAAAERIRRAIGFEPRCAAYHFDLGRVLHRRGEARDA